MVIFLDTGDLSQIEKYIGRDSIHGVTTNPSLIRSAGVTNYRSYAKSVLGMIGDKDVSFEVLADDDETMQRQAIEIASWGKNVYVKIPCYHTDGTLTEPLIRKLDSSGVRMNVTALLDTKTIRNTIMTLTNNDHILSVFAGRIADTGMRANATVEYTSKIKKSAHRVLWASARQVYDYYLAQKVCDIITLSPALIDKLMLQGKSLRKYSVETCQQFHRDGQGIEFG